MDGINEIGVMQAIAAKDRQVLWPQLIICSLIENLKLAPFHGKL